MPAVEFGDHLVSPMFPLPWLGGKQLGRKLPDVFPGVIEIDDLNGAREVLAGNIPDPIGAVAQDHFLLRSTPAAFPGFGVDARAEPFRGFDGSGIGGGVIIADGTALFVDGGPVSYT